MRDKVARARYELPRELEPPVIDKINMSSRPIVWLPLNSDRSQVEVTEYLKYTVKPYLETINGRRVDRDLRQARARDPHLGRRRGAARARARRCWT